MHLETAACAAVLTDTPPPSRPPLRSSFKAAPHGRSVRSLSVLSTCAAALLLAVPAAGQWTHMQADAARAGSDGSYDGGSGDELWRVQMHGFSGSGATAVVGDTVYRVNGDVWAFDAESGEEVWRTEYDTGFAGPVVNDGRVHVAVRGPGLAALDAATGQELWRTMVDPESTRSPRASPAVADGTVAWAGPNGQVVALDAATGQMQWNRSIGRDLRSSPALAEGHLFVASDEEDLWALELATGETVWRYPLRFGSDSSPAVWEGRVFVGAGFGADEGLHAVWAGNGTRAWHTALRGCDGPPTVQAGRVFAVCAGELVALAASDGRELWRADLHPTTDPAVVTSSDAVAAAGRAVFAGEPGAFGHDRGNVTAFDAVDGDILWRVRLDVFSSGLPAVADGRLLIATDSFPFLALDAGDPAPPPLPPEPLWELDRLRLPADARPGENATVTVWLANSGLEPGDVELRLLVDGDPVADRTVGRGAGEGADETFRFVAPTAGTYPVRVAWHDGDESGHLEAELVVAEESGESTPLGLGAVAALLVAAVWARRR